LGQEFGKAPISGYDSTTGTLAHEISHYKSVGNTEDHVYGQVGATSLAKKDSDKAINNADNFQYFVEGGSNDKK